MTRLTFFFILIFAIPTSNAESSFLNFWNKDNPNFELKSNSIQAGQSGTMVPGSAVKVSEAEIKNILEEIGNTNPLKQQSLLRLKEQNPSQFQSTITRLIAQQRRLDKLKKEDPEAYQHMLLMDENRDKIRETTLKYHQSKSASEKIEIENTLRQLLEEQFTLKMKDQKKRALQMEEKVKKFNEDLLKQEKNKDEHISERLEMIVNWKEK